jgi:hypothetical protein
MPTHVLFVVLDGLQAQRKYSSIVIQTWWRGVRVRHAYLTSRSHFVNRFLPWLQRLQQKQHQLQHHKGGACGGLSRSPPPQLAQTSNRQRSLDDGGSSTACAMRRKEQQRRLARDCKQVGRLHSLDDDDDIDDGYGGSSNSCGGGSVLQLGPTLRNKKHAARPPRASPLIHSGSSADSCNHSGNESDDIVFCDGDM